VAVKTLQRTGTNALPYINTPSFWVPDATLGVQAPVDVELPDARCVADDSWHSWMVVGLEEWSGGMKAERVVGDMVYWQGREVHGVSSSRDGDGKENKRYL
jgi:hypothetical protein